MPGPRGGGAGNADVLRSVVTSALNIAPLSPRAARTQLRAPSASSRNRLTCPASRGNLLRARREEERGGLRREGGEGGGWEGWGIIDGRINTDRSPSPKDALYN